jgi:hypothetical protein
VEIPIGEGRFRPLQLLLPSSKRKSDTWDSRSKHVPVQWRYGIGASGIRAAAIYRSGCLRSGESLWSHTSVARRDPPIKPAHWHGMAVSAYPPDLPSPSGSQHGWVQRQSSGAIRRLNDGRGREATRVEGSVHGPARALCTKEATAMRALSIKLIGLACRRSLGQQSRGVTRSLLTSRFQTQNPDW